MKFQVRIAKPQDFVKIRQLMDQQHWNYGVYDYLAYSTKIDSSGFFVGTLDGQVIASISAVKWNQEFAFVGLYIVTKKQRGKGYGIQVWNHALETVKHHNVALYANLDQQNNYRKSGFKSYQRVVRHETVAFGDFYTHQNVKLVKDFSFENILAYDQLLFPAKRAQFLKSWISLPQSYAFVYQDKQNLGCQKIQGYAVMQKALQGFIICPLFADSPQIAQELLKKCLGQLVKKTKVFIDVPDNNKEAMQLATKYKMQPVFACVKMYNKYVPKNMNESIVYGVATLNFG